MKSSFPLRLFGLMVVFALAIGVGAALGECANYPNSRVAWIQGFTVCAYTGSGCTECWNSGGSSCATNGSNCTPQIENKSL